MATAAQITANRLNAQRSTGPRTSAGKDAVRFNALQHGLDAGSILIPGEDPEEYDRMVDLYRAQFDPHSPLEEAHLATIIHSDWMRRRLRRIQGKLYRAICAESGASADDLDILILVDSPKAKLLRRVTSELAALERSYLRALNDLRLIHRINQPSIIMPPPHLFDEKLASFHAAHEDDDSAPDPTPISRRERLDNPALRL
jgi:hypothetical protein